MSARRSVDRIRGDVKVAVEEARNLKPETVIDIRLASAEAIADVADATTGAAHIRERGADARLARSETSFPQIKVTRTGAWLRAELEKREREFNDLYREREIPWHRLGLAGRRATLMCQQAKGERRVVHAEYLRHFRDVVEAVPEDASVELSVRESAWFSRGPWS